MDTKQQTAVMERRFWKRLCALNRFSFFVLAGGVARAADKAGNWIEAHSAQEIVDDAECEVSALKQRIADLEARLEVDARHPYDGIACRDATIAELQAGYDAARLEIASLRERVQQLARDVNSRRVTELEAQLGRWGGWR